MFTEKVNQIVLGANSDERIQYINSTEAFACVTSKILVCRKEKIQYHSIIKQYKNN